MAIPVVCPSCGGKMRAPDAALGRSVKCLKCGTPFVIAHHNDDETPTPKPQSTGRKKPTLGEKASSLGIELDRQTKAAGLIGLVGFLMLALSPLLYWATFAGGGVIGLNGDGKYVIIATIVAVGLCLGGFLLKRKEALLFGLTLGQMWGIVAAFWMGGLIWKFSTIFEASGIERNPFAGVFALHAGPGNGLYLGLFGAVVIAGALGFALVRLLGPARMRTFYLAQVAAIAFGVLWTTYLVRHFQLNDVAKVPELKFDRDSLFKPDPDKSGTAKDKTALKVKAQDYIKKHLDLYEVSAKYRDAVLDGRIPGVTFKLRNRGDRTLRTVEVTIYFKDAQGRTIAEEDFHPVLVTDFSLGDNKPLKPGYVWQMESGKFYAAKSVPSEWKEGSFEAVITEIEFEDEN